MEKTMSLINRYIHEVGRHLPRKNRADILAELQSLLSDTLEDRTSGEPSEEDVVALLEEFGPPKKVAASYYPEGQYLIGPTLFPVFRLVVVIAIASVIGAQLLSVGISLFFTDGTINLLDFFRGIMTSIPVVLGSVVIAFIILQWFEVKADITEDAWKPQNLPEITDFESVKRWERIIGIVGAVFILGLLAIYQGRIGYVVSFPGGDFYENPVIVRYFGLISLVLILSIVLDTYLLWQGRWQNLTRIAKVGLDMFSIAVLALLVQGHTAWLVERNVSWFSPNLENFGDKIAGTQVVGMQFFRMAFGIALIVTIVEVIVMGFRLIRANMIRGFQPISIPLRKSENSPPGESG
jgi:hypothetical protein